MLPMKERGVLESTFRHDLWCQRQAVNLLYLRWHIVKLSYLKIIISNHYLVVNTFLKKVFNKNEPPIIGRFGTITVPKNRVSIYNMFVENYTWTRGSHSVH